MLTYYEPGLETTELIALFDAPVQPFGEYRAPRRITEGPVLPGVPRRMFAVSAPLSFLVLNVQHAFPMFGSSVMRTVPDAEDFTGGTSAEPVSFAETV